MADNLFLARLIAVYLPYLSILLLIIGFLYRLFRWVRVKNISIGLSAFPFRRETRTFLQRVRDILFFPTLPAVSIPLWLASWMMHLSLALMLVGHLRLISEITPLWTLLRVGASHIDQVSHWTGSTFGVIFIVAACALLFRRLSKKNLRPLSIFGDYFALSLLLAIGLSGMAMRFWSDVNIKTYRAFFLSLLQLRAVVPPADPLFLMHFLLAQVLLIYLPLGKLVHFFASPLTLLVDVAMKNGKSNPTHIAIRQGMELDACMHCLTCSLRCSVAVAFHEIPNINIFPSEKIAAIKALISGKKLSSQELRHLQEGVYLCTNCYRCTVVCPVGINLQDLWFNVREALLQKGYPEFLVLSPLSFYRGLMREETVLRDYQKPLIRAREAIFNQCDLMKAKDKVLPLTPTDKKFQSGLNLSAQAKNFSVCFGCQTCTAVCPVVANYENPQETLGLLPHQIMHATGLGLRDLAFGSNMLWDCLTCYQCQEQCPQGVAVTDVLYELKNLAVQYVREKRP